MCYCFFRLIGYWAQECHLPSSEGKTRIYTIGQAPHQKAEFLNGILHFPQAGGIPSSSDSSMKLATRECIAQYPWGPQKKKIILKIHHVPGIILLLRCPIQMYWTFFFNGGSPSWRMATPTSASNPPCQNSASLNYPGQPRELETRANPVSFP